jgi:hypothetical protein
MGATFFPPAMSEFFLKLVATTVNPFQKSPKHMPDTVNFSLSYESQETNTICDYPQGKAEVLWENAFIHLFIHPFIQTTVIECLLCARNQARYSKTSNEQHRNNSALSSKSFHSIGVGRY